MTKRKVFVAEADMGTTNMFRHRGGDKYHVLLTDDEKPDLICFTGGADVNPILYGEEKLYLSHIDINRDSRDKAVWDQWPDVPKVGICRGGQFLNVMSGGAMWQHVSNHGLSHKMVNLLAVDGISEVEIKVTSTHHQMMIPSNKAEVIAFAVDGGKGIATEYKSYLSREIPKFDTEVVWYDHTNSLCFQPHPEYHSYPEMTNYFFKLLDHFFFGGVQKVEEHKVG